MPSWSAQLRDGDSCDVDETVDEAEGAAIAISWWCGTNRFVAEGFRCRRETKEYVTHLTSDTLILST
jgi:hypothetical protein